MEQSENIQIFRIYGENPLPPVPPGRRMTTSSGLFFLILAKAGIRVVSLYNSFQFFTNEPNILNAQPRSAFRPRTALSGEA